MRKLIVGLGNPGKQYEKTRHNIGFHAVELLARKHGLEFKKRLTLRGALAEGTIADEPCTLLKPLTYMNLSGESVVLTARYRNVEISDILIIVDDVAIPMGQTRLRINSSSGGHNGLKSIEECLQTNQYARLRLGVGGSPQGIPLEDHVLGRFSEEEEKLVPALLLRAVEVAEAFINNGLTSAMDIANR
jgi:PTH1 family peptidyl-tRNA hydrolase